MPGMSPMPNIQRLNSTDLNFWPRLEMLTAWEGVADEAVAATVREILAQVRLRGDDALLEYTCLLYTSDAADE